MSLFVSERVENEEAHIHLIICANRNIGSINKKLFKLITDSWLNNSHPGPNPREL